MRQVMPHRNNIELRRTKIKRYFSNQWKNLFKSRKQQWEGRRSRATRLR
jgi:hypothetical protein